MTKQIEAPNGGGTLLLVPLLELLLFLLPQEGGV